MVFVVWYSSLCWSGSRPKLCGTWTPWITEFDLESTWPPNFFNKCRWYKRCSRLYPPKRRFLHILHTPLSHISEMVFLELGKNTIGDVQKMNQYYQYYQDFKIIKHIKTFGSNNLQVEAAIEGGHRKWRAKFCTGPSLGVPSESDPTPDAQYGKIGSKPPTRLFYALIIDICRNFRRQWHARHCKTMAVVEHKYHKWKHHKFTAGSAK